ncbi:nucleotidyltransferase family protein [Paracoccus lichenicola]|uniref:nucleotidyltransferase family protein n=1 Tax=Paracoccus lichenicola TaxID=2665644 RepID=UPI0018AA7A0A|nr:hypothetical protein [Paracoccus lichenicola]
MRTPSQALEQGRDLIRDLAARHHTANPRLFGSVLTGQDRENSDPDLLVEPLARTTLNGQPGGIRKRDQRFPARDATSPPETMSSHDHERPAPAWRAGRAPAGPLRPGGSGRMGRDVAKAMAFASPGSSLLPPYQLVSTEPSYFSSMKAFTAGL